MNSLKLFCLVACLLAASSAKPQQKQRSLNPTDWLSPSELESAPSLDQISLAQLESMPLEQGAKLIDKLYHLAEINHDLNPSFVPSASNVPVYIISSNGRNVSSNLNSFVSTAKSQPKFGEEEVTVLITGLPSNTHSVAKAIRKLVEAYIHRYNAQSQGSSSNWNNDNNQERRTSSEENSNEVQNAPKPSRGDLIVIELGKVLNDFQRLAMLDIEETGEMIGKKLVELTEEADVPSEMIHVVGQGVASHVAGAAGRQYTRMTGQQLRRITALDPSKIFSRKSNSLVSLARGDAEFVDAIHTSVYGMGKRDRVGDVDYYPNGPNYGVPGADNVVEASMRATRYFAESVRPGNERNFPAVPARSLQEYKNKNGYGKRTYMGIDADIDMEGDYVLEVNPKSPFGKSAPAEKQNNGNQWKKSSANNQMEY